MTTVACFHGQHLLCLKRVFKIPFALLAFAITLYGINTQDGNQKTKKNQDTLSGVQREKLA